MEIRNEGWAISRKIGVLLKNNKKEKLSYQKLPYNTILLTLYRMKTEINLTNKDCQQQTLIQTDSSNQTQDIGSQQPLATPNDKPLLKKIEPFSFYYADVIGCGFSSIVYKGIKDNDKSQVVAIKVVQLTKLNEHRRTLIENQAKILKMVRHPNIVSLIDIIITNQNCYFVTEYCSGGSLQYHLEQNVTIQWGRAAFEIGGALQYLASNNIIHRDIKPANVLIQDGVFKLGDFGFACQMQSNQSIIKQQFLIGSPLFMPPEALINNIYSVKGDAFGFGVFIYYLITKRYPWKGKNKHELARNYGKRKASQRHFINLPPKLKYYINGLLDLNSQTRMSIHQLDLEIFLHIRKNNNIEQQLQNLSVEYTQQLKLCQFIHFLMINLETYAFINPYLFPMMSKHLGQLIQIFQWYKQPNMQNEWQKYSLPIGQYKFGKDEYYWLDNCLKDTIRQVYKMMQIRKNLIGLLQKLLTYQILVEKILFDNKEDLFECIQQLTLHFNFEQLRPNPQQIARMIDHVDFYQL